MMSPHRRSRHAVDLALLALLACSLTPPAGAEHTASASRVPGSSVRARRVATGLSRPVLVTAPVGDDRLFIVQQNGLIRILDGGLVLPTPFLDLTGLTVSSGEQGLLGLAFPPDYATTGLFYVNYTDLLGDTVIARYSVSGDPDVASAASASVLLQIDQTAANHNGGTLAFGPDGNLWIGMGDGGANGADAQNDGLLLGKMLRIDPDGDVPYGIPPDNPYVGGGDPRDEIWSEGLRNPYRWSFDRMTGDLYIADVGQNTWEEIDFEPAGDPGGRNWGWNQMEGAHCFPPGPPPSSCTDPSFTLPIHEYAHSGGRCSVTGGHVYRGDAFPSLQGRYFFGDFCTGELFSFVFTPGAGISDLVDHTATLQPDVGSLDNISGFGEDGSGELYVTDIDGDVFRLVGPPAAWVLDGLGAVHPAGGAAAVAPAGPYFGFDAAIDMENAGAGVWVLDAFGGLHAAGGASPVVPAPPYFGFHIARDMEAVGGGVWVLDGFGGLHTGGGAPPPSAPTPFFGFDAAADLETGVTGFLVLDVFGGVHAGDGEPLPSPAPPYFGFDIARDLELAGGGIWVLDGFGVIHTAGGALPPPSPTPFLFFDIARDLEVLPGGSHYVLDGFGGLHAGGGAVPMDPVSPYFGFDVARDLEMR